MKKEIKNIETAENIENGDLPLASIVINEYININKKLSETNESLQKSNKRVSILALILLVLFAIETTYIIIYWDSMHPHAGAIQEKRDE